MVIQINVIKISVFLKKYYSYVFLVEKEARTAIILYRCIQLYKLAYFANDGRSGLTVL